MKKFIMAGAAVAALLFSTAPAFAGAELSVDAFSRHVWRGTAGSSSISIQPTLDLATVDTNVGATSLGIWGQIPITGDETEYDITLSQEINDYGTVNITSYYYDGPFLESDSHDIEVGGDSFALVNVGVSVETEGGYAASFIYNPDSETPFFVVSKSW